MTKNLDWNEAIVYGLLEATFNCYIIQFAWRYGLKVSRNLWEQGKEESVLKMVTLYLVTIIGEFILGEFILGVSAYILS